MGKAKRELLDTAAHGERTLLLGVHTHQTKQSLQSYFDEFESLVQTAGINPVHRAYMRLRDFDIATFFTKGKLEELIALVKQHDISEVVVSTQLSPLQERNIQEMVGCTVFDRTQLILEIFKQAAHSAEGKIQVEMAELEYLKTRLAGRGKEMAQQEGFVGAVGPGETQKEHLRRYYEGKLVQARKRLKQLAQARETQRKLRIRKGIPLVSLVGYTNAGKSSVLNALTRSEVLVEDKLFATLDTTTRELYLAPHKKVLLADTVGFISELSHKLIEAFQSTLEELKYAHLLIHVVDISNPAWKEHIAAVKETLKDLGTTAPIVYALNKIDRLDDEQRAALVDELIPYQPYVIISTLSKEGVAPLLQYISTHL